MKLSRRPEETLLPKIGSSFITTRVNIIRHINTPKASIAFWPMPPQKRAFRILTSYSGFELIPVPIDITMYYYIFKNTIQAQYARFWRDFILDISHPDLKHSCRSHCSIGKCSKKFVRNIYCVEYGCVHSRWFFVTLFSPYTCVVSVSTQRTHRLFLEIGPRVTD